uniref:Uncharacterized protein n=1 Tax=Vitis vinifera TaxID=29760 RepID=F6H5N1_VITVI
MCQSLTKLLLRNLQSQLRQLRQ